VGVEFCPSIHGILRRLAYEQLDGCPGWRCGIGPRDDDLHPLRGICGDGRQDALIVFTEAVVLIEGNATVAAIGRALAKEVFSASDTIKFTTLASVRDLNTTPLLGARRARARVTGTDPA
jgi:hypothetical protein